MPPIFLNRINLESHIPLFIGLLNSTNSIEQRYVKNLNTQVLREFFTKKMLTKILVKF